MVGVDTNIVVRLLTADDPDQFRRSEDLFKTEQVFIPDTVILETERVLRFAYKFTPVQISRGLRKLFGLPNVVIQDPAKTELALNWHDQGLDFSDALHLAHALDCDRFITFDRNFVRVAQELPTIPVALPPE